MLFEERQLYFTSLSQSSKRSPYRHPGYQKLDSTAIYTTPVNRLSAAGYSLSQLRFRFAEWVEGEAECKNSGYVGVGKADCELVPLQQSFSSVVRYQHSRSPTKES
jgi:hypothetical protein